MANYLTESDSTTLQVRGGGESRGSEAAAPAVLQREPEEIEVAADLGGDGLAAVELDGVMARHGERQRDADAGVRLLVVVLLAVDRGASAAVVGAVERAPERGAEAVN